MKETKYKKSVHCVVKRKGRTEEYDERKVYGSVYAACLSVNANEKKCETTANLIAKKITTWIKVGAKKGICVDTRQIGAKVVVELKKHDKDAAFMYETHRDIS